MRSKGGSLSAGVRARHMGQNQDLRANLPDNQWFGVAACRNCSKATRDKDPSHHYEYVGQCALRTKGGAPMQFGLFTLFDFFRDRQTEVTYYKDTLGFMIYAEQLGFDSVWVGEEHFYSFGICPSPQLFLTAVAQATTRVRLGTAL